MCVCWSKMCCCYSFLVSYVFCSLSVINNSFISSRQFDSFFSDGFWWFFISISSCSVVLFCKLCVRVCICDTSTRIIHSISFLFFNTLYYYNYLYINAQLHSFFLSLFLNFAFFSYIFCTRE